MQPFFSILGLVRGWNRTSSKDTRDGSLSLNVWVQFVLLAVAVAVLVNVLFGLLGSRLL